MITKNLVLVFLGIYALVSCTNRPEDDEPVASPVVLLSEKNIPERMLKIDTRPDTLDTDRPAQHLFGRFFNKNAEFYVVDSPNKTLYNQPVKSITLYYLGRNFIENKIHTRRGNL